MAFETIDIQAEPIPDYARIPVQEFKDSLSVTMNGFRLKPAIPLVFNRKSHEYVYGVVEFGHGSSPRCHFTYKSQLKSFTFSSTGLKTDSSVVLTDLELSNSNQNIKSTSFWEKRISIAFRDALGIEATYRTHSNECDLPMYMFEEILDAFVQKKVGCGPFKQEISMQFVKEWGAQIWSDLDQLKYGPNTVEFWVYYKFAGRYRLKNKSALLFQRLVAFEKCFPNHGFPSGEVV